MKIEPKEGFTEDDEFTVTLRGDTANMQDMGGYVIAWVEKEIIDGRNKAFVKIRLKSPGQCIAFMYHIIGASLTAATKANDENAAREFQRLYDLLVEVANRLDAKLPVEQARVVGGKKELN